jgi:predicted RNA binding protein YcfA (HicA-like mRNA interferase family)
VTWAQLQRRLKKAGFRLERQASGSHQIWVQDRTGKRLVIAVHTSKEIAAGLVQKILKEAGIK